MIRHFGQEGIGQARGAIFEVAIFQNSLGLRPCLILFWIRLADEFFYSFDTGFAIQSSQNQPMCAKSIGMLLGDNLELLMHGNFLISHLLASANRLLACPLGGEFSR